MAFKELVNEMAYHQSPPSKLLSCNTLDMESCMNVCKILEDAVYWEEGKVNDVALQSGIKLRSSKVLTKSKIPRDNQQYLESIKRKIIAMIPESEAFSSLSPSDAKFIRYKEGDFVRLHADSTYGAEHIKYTVLTYLNREFEGGKTLFPMQDIEILPEPGSTIIFPADYIHESTTLLTGKKYILMFFLEQK